MKLRWYQREAVEAAWLEICKQDNSHTVIVMPTGSGKSLVIAELARRIVKCGKKLINLAHRKELLQQNAAALKSIAPSLDIGIYSAGLKSRNTHNDVIFAGIASVYKRAHEFGERVLVIVDEAHLVPNNEVGMYQRFISDIEQYNQSVTFVGLTATPFRTEQGPICDGTLFKTECYRVPVRQLMDEKYLADLTLPPKGSLTQVDVENVSIDYKTKDYVQSDLAQAFMAAGVVELACKQIIDNTPDRKSVIIFCVNIEHAEAVKRGRLVNRRYATDGASQDLGAVQIWNNPVLNKCRCFDNWF